MATKNAPIVYALVLGTSSVQILPPNPTRTGLVFFNNGSNTIAICPQLNNVGNPVAAAINGAGSINITAGSVILMPPVAWIDANATSGFNGIASAPGAPFTVWEF